MNALVFERNMARFAASRVVSSLTGSGRGAAIGPLRLLDVERPKPPRPDWVRVRPLLAGICGSDLAAMDGRSSRYFEDLVSFPFTPGHEVVGVVDEPADTAQGQGAPEALPLGTRVVVEPVLSCLPRAVTPPCAACAGGHTDACERLAFGHLAPGLQIGFCAETGGGWSAAGLVAHRSQLHRVPDHLSDEEAVLVEPAACAVHAALASGVEAGAVVAVIGAGTVGLTTISALRHLTAPGVLVAGAKHPEQQRLAAELGADVVVPPDHLVRAVRRLTRSLTTGHQLTGGADVVVDCVGSSESLSESLALVRPRGRVVLVGMPARVDVDLASLWHRQVTVSGVYAYGVESMGGGPRRTFDIAFDLVAEAGLGRLVSARYPLERFEEALGHAGAAGRRGAVKIVFDLRPGARARRGG